MTRISTRFYREQRQDRARVVGDLHVQTPQEMNINVPTGG